MYLNQNVGAQNSTYIGNNDLYSQDSGKYKNVIDKVHHCVNDHLLMLMNQMLSSADSKLVEQADKTKSEKERQQYMDCTRIFRSERNEISHHFFINLNTVLSSSDNSTSSEENNDSSLVVGHDEMEEMVAITTMHAKAMSIFGQEVSNLEARLEYLEIMCEDIFDKEALDPKHICEIFQKTIENIDIAIEVKLIFYKLFDQQVCSKLGVMYKSINQIFIDNDIMPEIIMKTTKNEEVDSLEDFSSRVASYYDPSENVATDFIPRTKEDISRIVNDFMSGGMTITGDEIELPESFLRVPTKQDLEGKNCYERKEVLRALSNLQRKLTSLQHDAKCLSPELIKKELLADISKTHGGAIDKNVNLLDERSIDFVGMMFGAIIDDNTISELMTNLIYQLQIPVMKLAMSDNTLFDNEEHPARVTVDLLTSAGKGINAKDDHLYDKLEVIVDDILDNFDADIGAFEKAVNCLQVIIQKEDKLAKETEKKQQKHILQEHAKNIVITQLKMASCNKQIPDQLRPLILKNWTTLMLNRYITHGRESSQWIESVLLLKLLLKCMQPINFPSQYYMVKSNHMALIEAVNDELYETSQDKTTITEQIAKLKAYFIKILDDYGCKIVEQDNHEIPEEQLLNETEDDAEKELQRIQQQTEIAKQKIAQLTNAHKPGVWYELYNGEDKPVRRLKLSVILTDAAQLIFVDRKGVKVIEKDAEDFARELEENRSRVLADHSTFDHALGNVIKALAA